MQRDPHGQLQTLTRLREDWGLMQEDALLADPGYAEKLQTEWSTGGGRERTEEEKRTRWRGSKRLRREWRHADGEEHEDDDKRALAELADAALDEQVDELVRAEEAKTARRAGIDENRERSRRNSMWAAARVARREQLC